MVSFTTLLASVATAATANALGINCQGSGLCVGNKGLLGQAQGQLRGMDQNKKVRDGEHAVCVKSSISIGDPSLCIFYQKTGREWTIGQTVQFVQNIIDHGCKACGSVPVDPGNNVNNGELTANMVTNAKKRDEESVVSAAAEYPGPRRGVRAEVLAARALGINCRGSSTCNVGGIGHSPAGTLEKVRDAVAAGPEGQWTNGQQIACVGHVTGRLCAFYQNIGNRSFNKGQTLNYLAALGNHGCRVCGSVPTDDGNDTSKGELTVNYVA
ncbi:Killer toxin, Kp4 [Cordyceps fumosorosea ARSEF 2679]|uniref:Killer toxin, Kp4 n=1 Tax=Cordyceps fumosorosea (strain ARSEF 2679) TaxID=1081104 RepID=A0A167UGI6_CORFA|nr:Killer toxin, Kp4 [Cordyceps fumosorosea ARSEF 2679]OAA61557.1 Killer toxin, Kp4 [Cordyceps fumosorosea ARSEF 2679]